jgi:hypothetical protein
VSRWSMFVRLSRASTQEGAARNVVFLQPVGAVIWGTLGWLKGNWSKTLALMRTRRTRERSRSGGWAKTS